MTVAEILKWQNSYFVYADGNVSGIKKEFLHHALQGKSQNGSEAFLMKSNYSGPIPVLIADQDMHEMTVAIALQGFRVSQLNPADSHCVFGEYWQNHGPAVEE
ncbi:unnamed protein product, partial [Rotaria sordida]